MNKTKPETKEFSKIKQLMTKYVSDILSDFGFMDLFKFYLNQKNYQPLRREVKYLDMETKKLKIQGINEKSTKL